MRSLTISALCLILPAIGCSGPAPAATQETPSAAASEPALASPKDVRSSWPEYAPVAVVPAAPYGAYPATRFGGPYVRPTLSRADPDTWMFRTRIRHAASGGVNFGGRYAMTVVGCGASCVIGFLTDLRSGRTMALPMWGETHPYLQFGARADSRLLRTAWQPTIEEPIVCAVEDFEVVNLELRSLGRKDYPGSCPDVVEAD